MHLLQDVAGAAGNPSISDWRAVIIMFGGALTAVFTALGLVQKGRTDDLNATISRMEAARKEDDATHERQLQAERDRTARAEKAAEEAIGKLGAQTFVLAEQSAAIREFGGVIKESAVESRRIQERLDTAIRTTEDLRRSLNEAPSRRAAAYPGSDQQHDR